MSETPLTWHPDADFFTVVCRLGGVSPDNTAAPADVGQLPDLTTRAGTVTISSTAPQGVLVYTEADGHGRILQYASQVYSVAAGTGVLTAADGTVGCVLVAPNSDRVQPHGYAYTATIKIGTAGPQLSVTFDATPTHGDGTVDLALLYAAPVADGTAPTTVAQALANMQAQIDAVSGGSGLNAEGVQDVVGAMVVGAGGTYNDAAGTITLPSGGGSSTIAADDTPAAPAEGESASYLVTSAVSWPAGLVWSTDPDSGTAPTITGTALVSMFTVDGVTRAVMGATFPGVVVPDTTAPAWSATLTTGTPATTSVVVAASALATDAVGVTGYERSLDGGSTWVAITPSGLNFTLSGLTAATAYPAPQFRAKDAAGNYSTPLTAQAFTTASGGDVTNPTPGTLASSAITSSGFTLTVTGASDAGGLHATPYAYSTDNGTTWSAWQAGATYNATGLAASTAYQARHKVRDAALNEATGTAITVTTGAGVTYNPLTAITWHSVYSAAALSLSDGASVTTWPDSSGNGRDATATATAPTYTAASPNFGNQPVVAFNNTELKTATFTDLAQPGSIVVIGRTAAVATTQRFVSGGAATKRWDVYRHTTANAWRMTAGTDLIGRGTGTLATIAVATFDGANSTIRVNGPTGQATGTAGTYAMGQIRLGATSTGDPALVGEVAFVGLKATPFTAQEITDLEAWAAAQFGVSLS